MQPRGLSHASCLGKNTDTQILSQAVPKAQQRTIKQDQTPLTNGSSISSHPKRRRPPSRRSPLSLPPASLPPLSAAHSETARAKRGDLTPASPETNLLGNVDHLLTVLECARKNPPTQPNPTNLSTSLPLYLLLSLPPFLLLWKIDENSDANCVQIGCGDDQVGGPPTGGIRVFLPGV